MHIIRAPTSLGNPEEIGNIDRTDAGGAQEPTPPLVGFQGTTVLRDLEFTASPNPNLSKRATNSTNDIPPTSTVNHFIRRQHRKLLGKIAILTYFEHPNSQVGKYQVSLSALANSDSLNRLTLTVPVADEIDLAWLMLPVPPQEPGVDVGFPLSQEPKGNMELATDTLQMVDQNPQVTGKLEPEALPRPQQFNWTDGDDPPDKLQHRSKGGSPGSKAEPKARAGEQSEAKGKLEVAQNSQVRKKPTHDPANQLMYRPRGRPRRDFAHPGDSERPGRSDEITGKEGVPFSS